MNDAFYVYLHRKKTDNSVFYVGKGHGKRAFSHASRNQHWVNTVKKHGFAVEFVQTGMQEWWAFELERNLISLIGRNALCNATDGGDGVAGLKLSDESIAKIKASKSTPEAKEAMSKWQRGVPKPESTKAKIAEKLKGRKPSEAERMAYLEARKNPEKEKRRMEARALVFKQENSRKKMSLAALEAQNRPEVKAAKSKALSGRKKSQELKAKISESVKQKLAQPEIKEKLRAAVKAAWAKRKANQCLGGKISNTYPAHLGQPPAAAGIFCF
jgi:hypothetical protein